MPSEGYIGELEEERMCVNVKAEKGRVRIAYNDHKKTMRKNMK